MVLVLAMLMLVGFRPMEFVDLVAMLTTTRINLLHNVSLR